MQVNLDGYFIEVVFIRKKNKNIYLRFKEDGRLYATCPKLVKEQEVFNLIENNKKKIIKMYLSATKMQENNLFFNYLGNKYTILYDETVKTCCFEGDIVFAKNEKMLHQFYLQEVKRVFTEEVKHLLPYFKNIPDFQLKFRFMKTRWGVNNRGNNTITLNTELLKKDIDLLDYVIIHELCHFYEANHSSRFWEHVSKYYPDYKMARKRLREE